MPNSWARRERQLQDMAGPLGRAKVVGGKHRTLIYKVTCTVCQDWSGRTYRSGHPNGYADALERWTLHLVHAHTGEQAPCLAELPAIKAARRERRLRDEREQQEADELRAAQCGARVERFSTQLALESLADRIVRD